MSAIARARDRCSGWQAGDGVHGAGECMRQVPMSDHLAVTPPGGYLPVASQVKVALEELPPPARRCCAARGDGEVAEVAGGEHAVLVGVDSVEDFLEEGIPAQRALPHCVHTRMNDAHTLNHVLGSSNSCMATERGVRALHVLCVKRGRVLREAWVGWGAHDSSVM